METEKIIGLEKIFIKKIENSIKWVKWACKNSDPIKYSKRAVFTALFFCSSYNFIDVRLCWNS